ncbi:MAG: hypothetical protein FD160_4134, partial [Caulobacteraceae bacterium]
MDDARRLGLACAVLVVGAAAACGDDVASGNDAAIFADGGGSGADAGPPPDDAPKPAAKFIPKPTAMCPGFAKGDGCEQDAVSLICTFEPKGVPARKARVWLDDGARDGGGALVFFWHGLSRMA